MRDPLEGVAADGTIVTGARRDRVPPPFEPAVDDVARRLGGLGPDVSVYLYGSVATGQAEVGSSDLDVVTIGIPAGDARRLGRELSQTWRDLCRGVEIAPSTDVSRSDPDAAGEAPGPPDRDRRYGDAVFLRHYCVHVAGPHPAAALPAFPADARAARGFNGDIAEHLQRWRETLAASDARSTAVVARRAARKTLLAAAGLVSVHDRTWTTDRVLAAQRWGEVDPACAPGLRTLLAWSSTTPEPGTGELRTVLDGPVRRVVDAFAVAVGLWES